MKEQLLNHDRVSTAELSVIAIASWNRGKDVALSLERGSCFDKNRFED
jgi:hypothetical protein